MPKRVAGNAGSGTYIRHIRPWVAGHARIASSVKLGDRHSVRCLGLRTGRYSRFSGHPGGNGPFFSTPWRSLGLPKTLSRTAMLQLRNWMPVPIRRALLGPRLFDVPTDPFVRSFW